MKAFSLSTQVARLKGTSLQKSTFIASRYKYIMNNEEKRGEEDGLLWFQDPTLLFCGFYNPLSGISSSTILIFCLFNDLVKKETES